MIDQKSTRPPVDSQWILAIGPTDEQTFRDFYKNLGKIDEMLRQHGGRRIELHGDESMQDVSKRHEYLFDDYNEVTAKLRQSDSFSWSWRQVRLDPSQKALLPKESKSISLKGDPSALTLDDKLDRIEQLVVRVGKHLHRIERRSRPKRWEVQVNLEEFAAHFESGFDMFEFMSERAVDIAQQFRGKFSEKEDAVIELIFETRTEAYAAVTALNRRGFKKVGVFPWDEDEIEMLEEGDLYDSEKRMHREARELAEADAMAREKDDVESSSAEPPHAPLGHQTKS